MLNSDDDDDDDDNTAWSLLSRCQSTIGGPTNGGVPVIDTRERATVKGVVA